MSITGSLPLTGGVICALVTPFGEDEKPDLEVLGRLIDRQIEAGSHGLFVSGTSGEGPLMTEEERRLVTEAAVERAAGRTPVVIHCGAPDTATSERLAVHAATAGADACAVVTPYFYRFGTEQLYRHFRSVAEAAPEIPHYIYENPERAGYSIGVDLVGRLVGEVVNIVGIKDTGDSIGRLTMYLSLFDPAPEVYTGNNSLIVPAVAIGARGGVSALANVTPGLFVSIYEAAVEGRIEEAVALQRIAARFQACFAGMPYVPAIKHLLSRSGLDPGSNKRPHSGLSDDQLRAFEERVDACEGLEKWLQ